MLSLAKKKGMSPCLVLCVAAGAAALGACGGDDAGSSTAADDAPSGTAATMAGDDGSGAGDDGNGTADSGSGAVDTGPGSTAGSGGADDNATAADAVSDGGPVGACDPASTSFDAQASISLDVAAMGCAVQEEAGTDPQLVLDIRDTGLIDVTAQGLSMSSASSGTYINPTAVVGIMPEVPITIAATADADGTPMTIEFEISTVGPVVTAQVLFGA